MMKDASPETLLLLVRAEAIAKGIDPTSMTLDSLNLDLSKGVGSMPAPLTDEQRSALDPTVASYLKSLEDAEAERVAKAIDESDSDADAALFEKSLAGLAEPVRKSIMAQQARNAENERMLKSLHNDSENAKFEAMAKSIAHLPGVDTDGAFASVMRKAATSNPTAFDGIFKVLKSADAAIVESGFFGEIGSALGGTPDSAVGSIEAIAKSLVKEDPTLSLADAFSKAAEENPELYAQHRKEA